MATADGPGVGTYPQTINEWEFTIELTADQMAALDAGFDAILELGSVTPPGMTNAQKITLSRLVPGIP